MYQFQQAPLRISAEAERFESKRQPTVGTKKAVISVDRYLVSLPGPSGGRLINDQQVAALVALKYPNGRDILTMESTGVLKAVVGLCFNPQIGVDRAIEYLSRWTYVEGRDIHTELVRVTLANQDKYCTNCGRTIRTKYCFRCKRREGKYIEPQGKGPQSVKSEMLDIELIFGLPTFKNSKIKDQKEREAIRTAEIVTEGVEECTRCHSRQVKITMMQIRSSDESETVKYECVSCGNRWSV